MFHHFDASLTELQARAPRGIHAQGNVSRNAGIGRNVFAHKYDTGVDGCRPKLDPHVLSTPVTKSGYDR
jgi:hypothetical protein